MTKTQIKVLRNLDPSEYEHKLDKSALDALEKVKGFDIVLSKISKHFDERIQRLIYTGSNIKVNEDNFNHAYQRLKSVCNTLDMGYIPELYIEWEYAVNAYTFGIETPVIIISSGCLDLLSDNELSFVLGHEVGHIKSGHVLYNIMAQHFSKISAQIAESTLGIGRLVTSGVEVALYYWYRMSEYTADRAGLLAVQDQNCALNAIIKIAGLPRKYYNDFNLDAFIRQAREFEKLNEDNLNMLAKIMLTTYRSHPWTVVRAKELQNWVDDGSYKSVLNRRTNSRPSKRISSTRTKHLGVSFSTKQNFQKLLNKHSDFFSEVEGLSISLKDISCYFIPAIPIKKLEKVVQSYLPKNLQNNILFIYDDTLWGSAKNGFCLTTKFVIWNNFTDEPRKISISSIRSITLHEEDIKKSIKINNKKNLINITGNNESIDSLINLLKTAKKYLK